MSACNKDQEMMGAHDGGVGAGYVYVARESGEGVGKGVAGSRWSLTSSAEEVGRVGQGDRGGSGERERGWSGSGLGSGRKMGFFHCKRWKERGGLTGVAGNLKKR
jgi:hypothetical protein